jgi:hypothetical protein
MSNMSHCRYENTAIDLEDVLDHLVNDGIKDLSESEMSASRVLREMCWAFIIEYDQQEYEQENR